MLRSCGFLPGLMVVFAVSLLSQGAWGAGVFSTPHFIPPGSSAVGLEPELVLSNGSGFGFNARFTHGVNELNNATLILGTGGGQRRFRAGGNFTFDFFPDIESQPGIGIAVQGMYYRLKTHGQFELTGTPYLHKTFVSEGGNTLEPFLAVPFGMAFASGSYHALSSLAIGSIFKKSESISYIVELGIAINRTDSYVSGGIVYFH